MARFWCWLEEEIHKNMKLTEVDLADKLLEFRSKQDGFLDTSFDTISGILISDFLIPSFPALDILVKV